MKRIHATTSALAAAMKLSVREKMNFRMKFHSKTIKMKRKGPNAVHAFPNPVDKSSGSDPFRTNMKFPMSEDAPNNIAV